MDIGVQVCVFCLYAGKDYKHISNGDVVILREILKNRCTTYKREMVAVLTGVDVVQQDLDPILLDRTIENKLIQLTRKPTRRVPKPKSSNLWNKKFVRVNRHKRKRAVNVKKNAHGRTRSASSLSTDADRRKNKISRNIKSLTARQIEHV